MDPREFLDTAETLADTNLDEPDWRSAISRAYYASFLEARQLLEIMQFEVSQSKDAHYVVRQHWTGSSQTLGRRIARELQQLHFTRKQADYNIETGTSFNLRDAQLAIEKANRIIRMVDQCRGDPDLYDRLQKAIAFWLSTQHAS